MESVEGPEEGKQGRLRFAKRSLSWTAETVSTVQSASRPRVLNQVRISSAAVSVFTLPLFKVLHRHVVKETSSNVYLCLSLRGRIISKGVIRILPIVAMESTRLGPRVWSFLTQIPGR